MSKIDKLYLVDSNDGGTVYHWFYTDKKRDNINYDEVIEGYSDMNPKEREEAEEYVNQFFTFDELKPLTHFLNAEFGIENFAILELSTSIETHCNENGSREKFLTLKEVNSKYFDNNFNDIESQDLPFKISGLPCLIYGMSMRSIVEDKSIRPLEYT